MGYFDTHLHPQDDVYLHVRAKDGNGNLLAFVTNLYVLNQTSNIEHTEKITNDEGLGSYLTIKYQVLQIRTRNWSEPDLWSKVSPPQ